MRARYCEHCTIAKTCKHAKLCPQPIIYNSRNPCIQPAKLHEPVPSKHIYLSASSTASKSHSALLKASEPIRILHEVRLTSAPRLEISTTHR